MPFTMQMVFVVILGHVVARAPPTARLMSAMARVPRTGRGAIVYVALACTRNHLSLQSGPITLAALIVAAVIAHHTAPAPVRAQTAEHLGIQRPQPVTEWDHTRDCEPLSRQALRICLKRRSDEQRQREHRKAKRIGEPTLHPRGCGQRGHL
jgi:Short chain fatty acid transporter